jgi:iron(III) transport system substrate-binding protein
MLSDRAHVAATITLLLVTWALSSCEPFPEQGVPSFPLSRARPTAAPPTATLAPTRPTPVRVTPLAALASTPVATLTAEPPDDAWLERAGLGPHPPAEEDADVLRRRAQDEGSVMLYSDSSRGLTSIQAMAETYPGITVEGYTWSAADIALRLAEDAGQGARAADVFLVADPVRVHDLTSRGWLWPYIPPDLADAALETTAGGLPIHHWSALLVVSGGAAAPASLDTWWDLTRAEWAGRVALSDPLVDDRTLYLLATIVERADAMAEAYRAEFGQEPPLDADCGDAGCLWIRSLLANQPALLHGDADVARWVGEAAGETRLGLCGYEQYIKVRRGELTFTPLWQLAPTAGLRWPAAVAVVDRAPHPQAAKLAVRWLYGSAGGGEGYAPWLEAGYYPARTDVADPPGALPRDELLVRLWEADPPFVSELLPSLRAQIADYLARH